MKKSGNWFIRRMPGIVFWLAVVIDLIVIAAGETSLRLFTKPLLMPLLIIGLATGNSKSPGLSKLVIAGLFFSLLGDVFLLWDEYFIPGLICFLTTHVLYILFFIRLANKNGWHLKKYPWLILLPAAYVVSILWFLFPSLGALKIPVIIYAAVIGMMLLSTLNLYKKTSGDAYRYFLSGAVFFVVSDSLLAINKFHAPFMYSGLVIMFTYCLAQYLIVKGTLELEVRNLGFGIWDLEFGIWNLGFGVSVINYRQDIPCAASCRQTTNNKPQTTNYKL